MHVMSEAFLDAVGSIAVINLHPALPGAFDGTHAIERRRSDCTEQNGKSS